MPIARFKDLCIDAADPEVLGTFWSRVLRRDLVHLEDGDTRIDGPTPQHAIWVNRVPEPKTAKNRLHLDIYAHTVAELEELGATVVLPEGDDRRWTVMADPEGGEFCAFLRDEVPDERLHGLVVDSARPQELATWWHSVLGGELELHGAVWATVKDIPDFPIQTYDFVPVPEAKTAKNRVHVDVVGVTADLVAAGASLHGGDGLAWDVLTDPEGNEFCAFPRS